MSGGSRPAGVTESWLSSTSRSQAPPSGPRCSPAPTARRRGRGDPDAANAAGSQRSKNSDGAMSDGGRSELSIRSRLVTILCRDSMPWSRLASLCWQLWSRRWRASAPAPRAGERSRAAADARPVHHGAVRAGDADATAVELNPGSLALLPGGGSGAGRRSAAKRRAIPRRGGGRYWARRSSAAARWGSRSPGRGRRRRRRRRARRFPARLCAASGRAVGLGVAWAHVWGAASGVSTPSTSVSARAGRDLAASASTWRTSGRRTRRGPRAAAALDAELAVRPLGTNRLELAVGAGPRRTATSGTGSCRAPGSRHAADGLRLYGEGRPAAAPTRWRFEGAATPGFALRPRPRPRSPGGDVGTPIFAPASATTAPASPRAALHGASGRRRWWRRPTSPASASRHRRRAQVLPWPVSCARWPPTAASPACCSRSRTCHLGYARVEELRELALLRAHGKATFAYAAFAVDARVLPGRRRRPGLTCTRPASCR